MPQPWRWQTKHVEKRICKPGNLHHFCEWQRKPCAFTNCFFYLSRPSGVWCSRKEWKIWTHSVTEKWVSCSTGKRKRRVFLCRRTARVKVRSKVIQQAFWKLKEGVCSLGRKTEERGTDRKLVGDQNPGPEAPPISKKGRESMSGSLRGRRSEEMTQSNTSSPQVSGSTVRVP